MDPHTSHTVRVVIADDHELARAEIGALLGRSPGISVVGEASNGAEAIHLALATHPDVVLMDVTMPVLDGVVATRQLLEAHDRSGLGRIAPAIVALLGGTDGGAREEYAYEAVREGARGVLTKSARPTEIVEAVHDAGRGDRLVRPDDTVRLIAALTPDRSARPDVAAARALLSTGDAIVVVGVGHGHDDERIGRRLGIATDDVRRRVVSCRERLGLRDRSQLAVFAYESGLLAGDRAGSRAG